MKAFLLIFLSLSYLDATSDFDINWVSYETALKTQKYQPTKKLLVFCNNIFCGPCKRMEKGVFKDPTISQLINRHFIPTKVTQLGLGKFTFRDLKTDAGEPLTFADAPTLIFIGKDGYKVYHGYKSVTELKEILEAHSAP